MCRRGENGASEPDVKSGQRQNVVLTDRNCSISRIVAHG